MLLLYMENTNEVLNKLNEQDKKIEAIYASVEKTRRYFKLTLWISVIVIVLPLIGILLMLPNFLKILTPSDLGL